MVERDLKGDRTDEDSRDVWHPVRRDAPGSEGTG